LHSKADDATRPTAPIRAGSHSARRRTLEWPAELERHLRDERTRTARRLIVMVLPAGARAPALDAWADRQCRRGRLSVIGRPGGRAAGRVGGRRGTTADPADRQRALLGSERGSFYARLHPDARPSDVATLLGTLRAGRTALLAVPIEAIRRSCLLQRLVARGGMAGARSPGSGVHVLHPTRRCLTRRSAGRPARSSARRPAVRRGQHGTAPAEREGSGSPARSLARQEKQLRTAVGRLHADPLACIVIVGPRGTGKSTLLARLVPVLQSLDERRRPPLVISAGTGQTSPLSEALPGLRVRSFQTLLTRRDCSIVIDEAASLPLAVLEQALDRHARVVMASTVDGYEASGRAFAGRFLDRLAHRRPGHTVLPANDRFRFGDDAVERTVRAAFFLGALSAPVERGAPDAADLARSAGTTDRVDIAALRIERVAVPPGRSERLAHRIVTLLGRSHYRITLDELDPLLDGRLEVTIARDARDEVVGVVVLAREGQLAPTLHADILARRRRLPDQLLPQLLARCAADPDALGERYARITRIAVAPGWRRLGIATRLVHIVRAALPADTALGASFADGAGVERFWRLAGMLPFHRGQRVNPRSGHRSVAVLAGGSERTREVLARARAVLADNDGTACDPSRDTELLARFSRGERGMAETLGPLNRAWQHWSGDEGATVASAGPRLGLPGGASGRQLERALTTWAGRYAL